MATALWTASSLGQAEEVRQMTADGADINQRGGPDAGSSPLHVAASQGHVEVVTVLLEAGAAHSAKAMDGTAPLHIAVLHDHTAVVGLLLAAGAEVSGKAGKGETPLHYSVQNPAITLQLLEAGANVSAKTLNGETALLLASRHGQEAVVRALLACGADVSTTAFGETALHQAAHSGHPGVSLLLLAAGADVAAKTKSNGWKAPLHHAANRGHAQVVAVLLGHGADAAATRTNRGETPLHAASQQGHLQVAQLLLAAHAQVYLTERVNGMVSPKSIHPQTRQLNFITPRGRHSPRDAAASLRRARAPTPLPRQSVGKGCHKSICPWALWLSKVVTAFKGGFEAIYPLHHSGVVSH